MARNLLLIGFMGAGKSAVAACLGKRLSRKVVEMDSCIEEREGKTINSMFQDQGETYFRDCESRLLDELLEKEDLILSCGGGAVLREENRALMKERGTVILLTASPETIYQRIKENRDRPVLHNRMSIEAIAELMKEREDCYIQAADVTVCTEGKNVDEICNEIERSVSER